jgi:hypothetical protein
MFLENFPPTPKFHNSTNFRIPLIEFKFDPSSFTYVMIFFLQTILIQQVSPIYCQCMSYSFNNLKQTKYVGLLIDSQKKLINAKMLRAPLDIQRYK